MGWKQVSGSCNVNLIGSKLKETSLVKHTIKRLQRMLLHSKVLVLANNLSLETSSSIICNETILALDYGDIVHQHVKEIINSAVSEMPIFGKMKIDDFQLLEELA